MAGVGLQLDPLRVTMTGRVLSAATAWTMAADSLQKLIDSPPIPPDVDPADLPADWQEGFAAGLTVAINTLNELALFARASQVEP